MHPDRRADVPSLMAWGTRSGLRTLSRQACCYGFLSIFLMVALALDCAVAADATITPKIYVGAGYDDNLFFDSQDKIDSTVLTASPGIAIDYRTLLSNFSLTADLDILTYLDESDLNRTNQYYRFKGNHRPKERWNTSLNFNYYRDTLLNTFLEETGRAFDRSERDFLEVRGLIGYDLTPVSGIAAVYRFQHSDYSSDLYVDYDLHDVSLIYSHRLKNEMDTISIEPAYFHQRNDLNDVDSFAISVGWARDWSPITRSEASIGARQTTVKQNDGTEDDDWGVVANLDITTRGIASSTTFRYFHDLRTNTDGSDVNVDNLSIDHQRSLSERFGLGINGGLVFSYKLLDRDTDINDERFYWIEPRLFYRLTKSIDLSLRYRYQNNVESRDDGDITRERNVVWLQLSYALPIPL